MDNHAKRELYTYTSNGSVLTRTYQIKQNDNYLTTEIINYLYNSEGLLDTIIFNRILPFTTELGPVERSIYSYENGKISSILTQANGSNPNNPWVDVRMTQWVYDGEALYQIKNLFFENNSWVLKYRISYIRSGGRLFEMVYEGWNFTLNVLEFQNKFLYSYDGNGNVISTITQIYVNNNWVNNQLEMYSYTASNLVNAYSRYQWNGQNWEKVYNKYYTYLDTKLILMSDEQYNSNTNSFVPLSKTIYSYPSNSNKPIFEGFQYWNVDSSKYITNYENYYTLNGFDKYSSFIRKEMVNNTLTNLYKITYEYDQFGNAINGQSFTWENENWVSANSGFYFFSMSYNIPEQFFYHNGFNINISYEQVTDVENEINPEFSFNLEQNYPNPFNPNTTIKFSIPNNGFVNLKVFDILGREVATLLNNELNAGLHSVNFNAQNLSSGTYFYVLKYNNYSIVKKMLLLK